MAKREPWFVPLSYGLGVGAPRTLKAVGVLVAIIVLLTAALYLTQP